MPPGAFVVESGVYKVGADREWERPEPIYWKQVVFGARNGSEGSGSMPRRRVGRLVEEDIQRLKAMEIPIKTQGSKAKLRASSPLDQNAPLIDFASPASEISMVERAEKSIPSTLLTSSTRGLSSISSPLESSRSMRQRSTLTSELTTLGTIPEASFTSEHDKSATVQADVHVQALPTRLTRRQKEELQKQLYWERGTYQAAEALFPNYALNYPAPIHQHFNQGSISPSIQYPEVAPPRYDNLFLQPHLSSIPLATSSPPLRSQVSQQLIPPPPGSQPLGLPFTTSTRTSLHDYENMRYPAVRKRHRQREKVQNNAENHRDSFVIDGELLKRHRSDVSGDAVSLVSEVLDAEVTALTNSSPGSSNGSTTERVRPKKHSKQKDSSTSTSSGIQSKNQTSSSSSGLDTSTTTKAMAGSNIGLLPIPESAHMYYYYDNLPFYENWPPPKQIPPQVKPRILPTGYQFVPPPDAISAALVPPLTPHQSQNQAAKPQEALRKESPIDTSLDTPPSAKGASRPGSAHSAPLLDLSIDRHYEFDTATRTPTDDIALHHNQPLLLLPQKWNRPYLGYNPRRDRAELGAAAAAANRDRVFSDSEIYSPVFPRGKPDGMQRVDISARVQAMKAEFAEYRLQQLESQTKSPPNTPPKSDQNSPTNLNKKSAEPDSAADFEIKDDQRLESLI